MVTLSRSRTSGRCSCFVSFVVVISKVPSGRADLKDSSKEEVEEDICFTFSLAARLHLVQLATSELMEVMEALTNSAFPIMPAHRKTNRPATPAALRYIINGTTLGQYHNASDKQKVKHQTPRAIKEEKAYLLVRRNPHAARAGG